MAPNPNSDTHVAFPDLPQAGGGKVKSKLWYQVKWTTGSSLWTKDFHMDDFYPKVSGSVLTVTMKANGTGRVEEVALLLSPETKWSCELIVKDSK